MVGYECSPPIEKRLNYSKPIEFDIVDKGHPYRIVIEPRKKRMRVTNSKFGVEVDVLYKGEEGIEYARSDLLRLASRLHAENVMSRFFEEHFNIRNLDSEHASRSVDKIIEDIIREQDVEQGTAQYICGSSGVVYD